MRQLMFDCGDNSGLIVIPGNHADILELPQLGLSPLCGDDKPRGNGRAAGELGFGCLFGDRKIHH